MAKARTKAQKRALKRGRPRLPPTEREPNGKPSRRKASQSVRDEIEERKNMHTVVSTRIRHNGIGHTRRMPAEAIARDPRYGYLLGRLHLMGSINSAQHDAGIRYAEDMGRFYSLTGIPFPSARAQNMFAVRGDSGETSEERAEAAKKARAKMVQLRAILLACGDIDTGRRVEQAVKSICLLDGEDMRKVSAPMMAWLVRGLNALGKHYGG